MNLRNITQRSLIFAHIKQATLQAQPSGASPKGIANVAGSWLNSAANRFRPNQGQTGVPSPIPDLDWKRGKLQLLQLLRNKVNDVEAQSKSFPRNLLGILPAESRIRASDSTVRDLKHELQKYNTSPVPSRMRTVFDNLPSI